MQAMLDGAIIESTRLEDDNTYILFRYLGIK